MMRAGGVMDDFGLERGRGFVVRSPAIVPAIIQQHAGLFFVAPHGVGEGAAAAQDFSPDGGVKDCGHIRNSRPK